MRKDYDELCKPKWLLIITDDDYDELRYQFTEIESVALFISQNDNFSESKLTYTIEKI